MYPSISGLSTLKRDNPRESGVWQEPTPQCPSQKDVFLLGDKHGMESSGVEKGKGEKKSGV